MGLFKNNEFIKAFKEGYNEAKNNNPKAKTFEISGYRPPKYPPFGDDVELEPGENGEYIVYHEDHHIGWIKSHIELEKFEEADSLTVIQKNGKQYVRFVPEQY